MDVMEYYEKALKEFDDVMTVDDLCKALKIGRNAAYRILKEGRILTLRNGRNHLIPKINVINYLISCTNYR